MGFSYLIKQLDYNGERIEDLNNPVADNAQEAWVKVLSYLRNKGEALPNARTRQELEDNYGQHAGLVVVKNKQVAVDTARKRQGTASHPKTTTDLSEVEDVEDTAAEEAFRVIEAQETLRKLYRDSEPRVQKALLRFATAFALLERGEPIPSQLRTAIARDRRTTGLALTLK